MFSLVQVGERLGCLGDAEVLGDAELLCLKDYAVFVKEFSCPICWGRQGRISGSKACRRAGMLLRYAVVKAGPSW